MKHIYFSNWRPPIRQKSHKTIWGTFGRFGLLTSGRPREPQENESCPCLFLFGTMLRQSHLSFVCPKAQEYLRRARAFYYASLKMQGFPLDIPPFAFPPPPRGKLRTYFHYSTRCPLKPRRENKQNMFFFSQWKHPGQTCHLRPPPAPCAGTPASSEGSERSVTIGWDLCSWNKIRFLNWLPGWAV